jgi:hypothetical protein
VLNPLSLRRGTVGWERKSRSLYGSIDILSGTESYGCEWLLGGWVEEFETLGAPRLNPFTPDVEFVVLFHRLKLLSKQCCRLVSGG